MKTIELNREELERGFENPGDPRTGIDEESLEKGLLDLLEKEKANSHSVIKAKAFAYLLDNMRIGVSPRDLFVTLGVWGKKTFRKTIFPVWTDNLFGNILKDGIPFREEILKSDLLYICTDFAHSVPDWDTILALGFKGLRERIWKAERTFLARTDHTVTSENRDFFLSVRIEYDAVERLMNRLCVYAENTDCQPETKTALRHLRDGAATTLYEAILQIWLYYQLSEYADLIETRSFGNLDRLLYPYYEQFDGKTVDITDEIPFDIPDNWEWCRLENFATLTMGQSPAGSTVANSKNGVEFHQGKIYFGERFLSVSPLKTTEPTRIAPKGSLLICVRAPVGIVNITEREICIGRGLAAVMALSSVAIDFLATWLTARKSALVNQATGSTFVAVSVDQVKSLLLPVPPLSEQKRIVLQFEKIQQTITRSQDSE